MALRQALNKIARGSVALACLGMSAGAILASQGSGQSSSTEPFVGDFEVVSPGWQQFDDLQRERDRPAAESFALVESPVRQGQRAARMTVRHSYSPFGHNESTQLSWHGGEREGDDYWYAWSTLFPADWVRPLGWGIFAEWHSMLATAPLIGMNANGDTAEATLLTGLVPDERTPVVDRVVPLLSTLSKGRWNDFVVHVRWSTRADGLVEIYHRVAGERSLRKLVSWRDVPTFQSTPDGRGVGTYLLFGLYRQSFCAQPTQLGCLSTRGVQPHNTLFHDGFVRARTFANAVARAFPGPRPLLPPAASRATQQEGATIRRANARSVPPVSVETDQGCSASATTGRRVVARIRSAQDRDTAVVIYRARQRTAMVIRHRLQIAAPRLSGPLVVTRIQTRSGRLLAQLYVSESGTLRLSSPRGALRNRRIDIDTGIAAGPGVDETRIVELRLSRSELLVAVAGFPGDRLVVRLSDLRGPRRGTQLVARVGIDEYHGRPGGGPVRAVLDEVLVGMS